MTITHTHFQSIQWFGWRSSSDRTVFIVNAAMTGAHEQSRVLNPANRATQVSAVDGKGDEFRFAGASDPGTGFGRHTRPDDRRGVFILYEHESTNFEVFKLTDRSPLLFGFAENWCQNEADSR